ncbi:MAG: type II toxin-antitoxin system RelE/ParE family toxin [Acidobacteriia bacterium]|nr:type II toxin-antitoxin system RelE/ParE family toxin [Terriglobia bacterium]
MTYSITILPAALRQLGDLPKLDQKRIKEKIDRLGENPRPPGVKRLQGQRDYWRIRVGDYRIIYVIEDDRLQILVVRIGHRREICRAL